MEEVKLSERGTPPPLPTVGGVPRREMRAVSACERLVPLGDRRLGNRLESLLPWGCLHNAAIRVTHRV